MDVQDPPSAFEEYNISKNKTGYSKPQKVERNSGCTPWFSKNKNENTVVLN
jgi:hypothetical protein